MRVLVTGGAGFIGSHVAESLLQLGHDVTILDDLSNANSSFVKQLKRMRCTVIRDSVANGALIDRVVERHDVVFHFAAMLGVRNCVERPLQVIEGNIVGTHHIAESCLRWDKKMIFSSTSEIYGKNAEIPFKEDANRVLGPTSIARWCYATAKALDEHVCLGFAKEGLRVTILRYFNIYGPRTTSSPYAGVIPIMLRAALANEPITVYGDGHQTRCFTYISDCVRGTIAAINKRADGQVINIGTSDEVEIIELAKLIVDVCQSESPIVRISYEEAYGAGYEDMQRRVPSLVRAKRLLDYEPTVSLRAGLLNTVASLQHQGGES